MTMGKLIRRIAFVLLAVLAHSAAQAFVYSSDAGGYSIDTGTWILSSKQVGPEGPMFRCLPETCGHDVRLTISTYYESSLKNGKRGEFLKYTNGKTLTQDLLTAKTRFKIVAEGRTRVGKLEAYEVVANVIHHDGQKYSRHTFMTFNAGNFYTIHLISPIQSHDKALQAAQPVLDSFSLK